MRVLFRLAAKVGLAIDDRRAGADGSALQVGAVPFRVTAAGTTEVLLVTSRSSGRWIVPKGWPVRGLSLDESAAREAYEEAGVRGHVAKRELGRIAVARARRTLVLFPLAVRTVLETWPERGQRRRRWMARDEAADAVEMLALRQLLRDFAPEGTSGAG